MSGTFSRDDHHWMRRALRHASLSLGATSPNPSVGCVLVRAGQEIGAGRHEYCGGPHGEISALQDCRARGLDPQGATAYITLAPCTRYGRTPPCVEALIAARIARVVAALPDPVQDDATALLRQAGIAYETGCLQSVAAHLHGGFISRVQRGRPRCTGKWAMTADGAIGTAAGGPLAISSPVARAASRRRRRAFDAILIGTGTAAADDPQLLAPRGAQPVRVVVGSQPRLAATSRLVRSVGQAPLLMVHAVDAPLDNALIDAGVQSLGLDDPRDPHAVLRALGERGHNDVLVEGGARLHAAWLAAGIYDRLELDVAADSEPDGIRIADMPTWDPYAHACTGWQWEASPRPLGTTLNVRLQRQTTP